MTPEREGRLAFRAGAVSGRWRGRDLAGAVTLFVEQDEVVVRLEATGDEVAVALPQLTGAAWRAGVLWLHLPDEELQLSDGESLDRAWFAVSQRACALPEVARAMRALRAESARHAMARERFFAPLLQARRRLEGDEPVDWRVASFDADALAERLRGTLAALALERHAERPPHRRALEAGLLDACDALFAQLRRVSDAGRAVHEAPDAHRFVEWRAWAAQLRVLFVHADQAWQAMTEVLAEGDRGQFLTFER